MEEKRNDSVCRFRRKIVSRCPFCSSLECNFRSPSLRIDVDLFARTNREIDCKLTMLITQYFEGCLSSVPPSTRIHSPLTNRLTTSDNATLPTSLAVPDPPTGVSNPNSFDSNEPALTNFEISFRFEARQKEEKGTHPVSC